MRGGTALVAAATNPLIRWEYLVDEWDQISEALAQHIRLTVAALAIGFVLSAGLAAIALRLDWTAAPITALTGFVYTIPSVALFGLLQPVFGLSAATAVLPLAGYTLLVLVTSILAGFGAVPRAARDAATGMGLGPRRRLLTVELPLALPFIVTGLRVAAVTTVGLVTVAAIVGQGGLGRLILNGLRRDFSTPMVVGASFSILLAIGVDGLLYALGRLATPWARHGRRRAA